jgi:signal transduction histidine kinase
MTLTTLRIVFLLSLLGLAVSVGILLVTRIDHAENERFAAALATSSEIDSRIDKEVAQIRLGATLHYDGLVRLADRMAVARGELSRPPAFVSGAERQELAAALAEQARLIEEKQGFVEVFKMEQAVLGNARRAFPHNAERLLQRLRAAEDAEPAVRAVERLEHDVLLHTQRPGAGLAARVRCAVAALSDSRLAGKGERCEVAAVEVPPSLRLELDTVLRYALVVVGRQQRVDGLTSKLMTLPVDAVTARASASYGRAQDAARERGRAWLIWTFLSAMAALATGTGYIIARLQTSARQLRLTTARLEEALAALRKERDRELEIAELKSRFVSMTSHEFRTPLSVILSSAELVSEYGEKWGKERRAEHLARIQESARNMSRMLDGVLLVGRAEAGMLEVRPAPLRLGEVTAAVLREVGETAGPSRRIEYECQAPDTEVWMDEKLLRHILINLLSNAFKYSPADGPIYFGVRTDEHGAIFEVRDEGIGIPEQEQEMLFEAFHRCSNAGDIPGTGLGMAVVKKSLDAHRGSIDVASKLGQGTRFVVRIPFLEEAA